MLQNMISIFAALFIMIAIISSGFVLYETASTWPITDYKGLSLSTLILGLSLHTAKNG